MKAITFTLPAGVQVPDGKQEGDTFHAMATFKLEAGSKVTLEAVDGEPLDGGGDESDAANNEANDDTTDSGPQPGVFGPGGSMNAGLMGGGGQGGP